MSAMIPAGNWGQGSQYGDSSSPDHDPHRNRRSTGVPWPLRYRPDEAGGMYAPWRSFEERVRTGPYGFTRFPSQPHSPVRILVLDGGMEERVNPRLRQFIQDSPPRIRGEWHLGPALEPEEPRLTKEEMKKAMEKLRKQVYNPPYPRRRERKRGLFSNWSSTTAGNGTNNNAEGQEKDEGKQCAVCLETFVANEQVLVTPCNHMFHNDCLVPWVQSHGQCPVCRFAFCERKQTASSLGNSSPYGYHDVGGADEEGLAVDLVALIIAMEEAFNWVALAR